MESQMDPEATFLHAKNEKKLYELDSRSIHKASFTYMKTGFSVRYRNLFLNVFPSTISNPMFLPLVKQIIHENGILNKQLILEINENEPFDYGVLKSSIAELKLMGIKIAIDDFGKGASSIQAIIELNPDYIKLDKYFMKDITRSQRKKEIIHQMLHFCKKFNISLIAEGVEDHDSLDTLRKLGVKYAQGYLLGRPALLS